MGIGLSHSATGPWPGLSPTWHFDLAVRNDLPDVKLIGTSPVSRTSHKKFPVPGLAPDGGP